MVPKWPGVVDEDVDGTKALDRLRDEILAGGFIRYVRGDGDRGGPFALKLVGSGPAPCRRRMSVATMAAPSRVRHFDMPKPMPPPAPVTMAVLSLSRMLVSPWVFWNVQKK